MDERRRPLPGGWRGDGWIAASLGAAVVCLLAPTDVPALDTISIDPDPVRLSPVGESYIDPEILNIGDRLTFQTGGGRIWLADLDPVTGLFRSPTGKDVLVDDGAYPVAASWNGPEFGVDAHGWSVFYTKASPPDGAPQIWRAHHDVDGWVSEPLTEGGSHQTALATSSLTRTGTRVLSIRGDWDGGTMNWFSDGDAASAHDLIAIDDSVFGRTPVRWSRDGRFVLYRDELGRVNLHDADTGEHRLVTDDGVVHDDPNGWSAPEFGGELVIAALVEDGRIAILRDLGGATWERIATLDVPEGSNQSYYGSPEPLVLGGRSYLSVAVKDQPNFGGTTPTDSEIWIIGIEPGAGGGPSFARRCDEGAPGVFRSDPETYLGSDEVFVYYNVIDRSGGSGGYELWRARTGLTPDGPRFVELELDDGRVRGFVDGESHAFRGLPYAAPPVGELRWQPPQPVEPWDGVRDAVFFGNPAPQTLATRVGGDATFIGSEDCLFLNVWTPADRLPGEPLPILFFVHGGGNLSGASSESLDSILQLTDGAALYDGSALAAAGRVVVVTVNYRLGPLGYLALPALDDESAARGGSGTSGNYGILDQIEALRWVQRNIEAFGGDRNRVMLFGQSGGARNTSVHLAGPQSNGLFSSAVMHSGVVSVRTRSAIDDFAAVLLAELGLGGTEPDLLDRLRTVDPEVLVASDAAQPIGLGSMTFSPHVDGYVLLDQPYNVVNRGEHARVPFVIGATSGEYVHRFSDIPDSAYEDFVIAQFGPIIGGQVLALYPLGDFDSAHDAVAAINGDKNLTCSTRRAASWFAANQTAPVFRYWFDHTMSSPLRLGDGAYHTSRRRRRRSIGRAVHARRVDRARVERHPRCRVAPELAFVRPEGRSDHGDSTRTRGRESVAGCHLRLLGRPRGGQQPAAAARPARRSGHSVGKPAVRDDHPRDGSRRRRRRLLDCEPAARRRARRRARSLRLASRAR
jgi:para-nitrobenzyl esterase